MPVYQIRHATTRMLLIACGLQSAHNTNHLQQAVNDKNLHKPRQPHIGTTSVMLQHSQMRVSVLTTIQKTMKQLVHIGKRTKNC